MNTLPRAITAQILDDSQTYYAIRQRWRELMRSDRKYELRAAHHLLYTALLGKDWRKGFTCVTNPRKIENGAFYGWALFRAVTAVRSPVCEEKLLAPFDGLVTPLMLERLRKLIPALSAFRYQPEQFTGGNFPFEAYSLPTPVTAGERNPHD